MSITELSAGPFLARAASPLDDALRFIQMSGVFYCPSYLSEPWGLELPPMDDCVWFHVVVEGEMTLEVGDVRATVQAGDLVLMPHGAGHRSWGRQAAPTPLVFELPHEYITDQFAVLHHGGGGEETQLVCGGIRLEHPASRQLLTALPPVIRVAGSRSLRDDWLRATLALLAEESRVVRPGGDAVVSRLCDIVVIQAIRAWLEHDPSARTGWLGALRDPHIGAAIARVHADPASDWSVASLAEVAAMSRSAFAARFTEFVGETAMRYVTRWRMYVAHDLLQSSDASIAAIGEQVGYESEAAFSRAFKRVMGVPPSKVRGAATVTTFR